MRDRDGTDKVLVDLADFQALLDAAHAASDGFPDVRAIILELGEALRPSDQDIVDLGAFLAEYDTLHGED